MDREDDYRLGESWLFDRDLLENVSGPTSTTCRDHRGWIDGANRLARNTRH